MRRGRRSRAEPLAAAGIVLLLLAGCGGDGGGSGTRAEAVDTRALTVRLEQYRNDEAKRVVQVQVRNTGAAPFTVRGVRLETPAFASVGATPKDSELRPNVDVDLTTALGAARCPPGDAPLEVPAGTVVIDVVPAGGTAPQRVEIPVAAADDTLARVFRRECSAERLAQRLDISFADTWRARPAASGGPQPDVAGDLVVAVKPAGRGHRYEVVGLGGSVIIDVRLDPQRVPAARRQPPYATLDDANARAAIPVVASLSRCDGHAKGEVKKPYAFLVVLREDGGDEQGFTVVPDDAGRAALRPICPF